MYQLAHPLPHWSTDTMRRVAEEPSLADAASRYADLGVPVFPCVPGGKQPLTPNGFHDATSSTRLVHDWWRRNPDANIGLPTGSVTGLVVVDVDVHSAGNGYAAFERSRRANLTAGWAWLVRTPSGGLHAYYPATPEIEQRSWQVPSAHIDFRGDGGYVIAPPSRIEVDGHPAIYAVIAAARQPVNQLDAGALRQFLEPPRRLGPRPDVPTIGAQPDKLADWVASRPQGARNGGLFWAACRMVENGHEHHESLALLGAAAQSAGLPEREVESTISSAYRIASRLSPTHASQAKSRLGPTRPTEGIAL